jgi:rod shape-determining protein MreD
MNYVLGFLFLVIIVLLETSVLSFFTVGGVQAAPLLVIVLSLQFLGLSDSSYGSAFLGGILLDLFSDRPLGSGSFILILISGTVGSLRRWVEGSLWALLLVTFLASLAFRLTQAFPVFEPAALFRGGLLDSGLMLMVYLGGRYLLLNVWGRREIRVGV